MGSGLSDSVGTGLGPLASYAIAAVVVLVLVVVVLVVAKRFMGPGQVGMGSRKGPRLAVLDVAAVDQRRKLVLIRRDEVEHLVLIGGQNDLVVEKGIVRSPQSLRPQVGERDESRIAVRGPAIAPQPRPPAGSSPLRRTVPRPNFEPVAVPEPAAEAFVEAETPHVAPPIATLVPSPAPVEAKVEAPRPVAPPVAVAPKPAPQSAPIRREEALAPPVEAATPVEDRSDAASVQPELRVAQAPTRVPDEPTEPRIPAFLRRGEVPAAPIAERDPEPAAPLPAPVEATRMAPPLPFFQTRPVVEPAAAEPDRSEGRSTPMSPPIFPTLRVPPSSDPIIAADRNVPAVEAPETPVPAQRPLPAPAPASEDAERRPLAVRSFATTIQSRRSNFEPSRSAGNGERPAPPAQAEPSAQVPPAVQAAQAAAIPSFLQSPASRTASPAAPPPAPAPAPEDLSLEETLSQKLNSDFGAVEWRDDKSPVPEQTVVVENDAPEEIVRPSAPATTETKPADRPLTLEEEMERLLSDFDFSDRRR